MVKEMLVWLALAAAVTSTLAAVTPAEQCQGQNFEDIRERVHVIPCGKRSCKLKKGVDTTVNIRFKPKKEVKQIQNNVYAVIAGVPLPFVGVDGTNACNQIYEADGTTPAPCPLKPGVEYVYNNVFPVHNFYPSVSLRVHWALTDGSKDLACFEVPASISA